MSGEWAATLTGRTMARFAPRLLAISAPASIAARSPETTTWPGELRLATTKVPCGAAASRSSGRRASSRPMRAAIAPSRPSPDACISSPRRRTRRTPSSSESTSAATKRGVLAHRVAGGEGRSRDDATRPRRLARARPRGSRSMPRAGRAGRSRSGPADRPDRPRRATRSTRSGRHRRGEDGRCCGRGRGEIPAHAHGLRALAGEDEGDR